MSVEHELYWLLRCRIKYNTYRGYRWLENGRGNLSISSLLDIYTTGGGERWNYFQNETRNPTECAELCFSHSSLFVHWQTNVAARIFGMDIWVLPTYQVNASGSFRRPGSLLRHECVQTSTTGSDKRNVPWSDELNVIVSQHIAHIVLVFG